MKKINSASRYGSFALIATAVTVAILIILNLAVNSLPATFTSITSEKTGVYTISNASKKYISSLDEEITIYVVQVENTLGEHDLMIKKYIERYATLSSKITVKYVDPEVKPMFLSTYNKDNSISEDALDPSYTHVVVESQKRARIIPYTDIFKYALSGDDLTAFYQAYGYIPYSYEIENCLLSAIDYVTLNVIPKIYYTSTHKEAQPDEILSYFAKLENIELTAIDLNEKGAVPTDAQALVIFAPQSDFTAKEIDALKSFAEGGGNIILSTEFDPELADRVHENLYGFIEEYYGLKYVDKMAFEGTSGRYYGSKTYIFVTMTDKVHSAVASATYGSVLFRFNHVIEVSRTLPEGVTVDTLFTTTDKGFAKTTYDSSEAKAEGDLSGTLVLGAKSTRKNGSNTSKLLWYASTDALRTNYNFALGESQYTAVYALSEAVEKRDMVSAVALIITHDVVDISKSAATLWSCIIIAVIPGAILGYGIYVRVRRVRR